MRMIRRLQYPTKRQMPQTSYLLPTQAQELRILPSLRTAREVAEARNATAIQLTTAA
jgi:hypothetical protein